MWIKRCKICWWPRNHNNPLISRCKSCIYKDSVNNPKQIRIKQKSNTNKNTVAKFDKKTKWIIKERDNVCVICWDDWSDFHHIYFSNEAKYTKDRNNEDQGVLLCRLCHGKAHWCKRWEWIRQDCINYINKKYEIGKTDWEKDI